MTQGISPTGQEPVQHRDRPPIPGPNLTDKQVIDLAKCIQEATVTENWKSQDWYLQNLSNSQLRHLNEELREGTQYTDLTEVHDILLQGEFTNQKPTLAQRIMNFFSIAVGLRPQVSTVHVSAFHKMASGDEFRELEEQLKKAGLFTKAKLWFNNESSTKLAKDLERAKVTAAWMGEGALERPQLMILQQHLNSAGLKGEFQVRRDTEKIPYLVWSKIQVA